MRTFRLVSKFSPWKRGAVLRKSPSGKSSGDLKRPVRKPRPWATVRLAQRDANGSQAARTRRRRCRTFWPRRRCPVSVSEHEQRHSTHVALDVGRPRRVLDLDDIDLDRLGRALERLGAHLRETDVLELAGLPLLVHRLDSLLDRNVRVRPVHCWMSDVVERATHGSRGLLV